MRERTGMPNKENIQAIVILSGTAWESVSIFKKNF